MRINFIPLLLIIFALPTSASVLDSFDADAVRDGFAQVLLCGSRETGSICQILPWGPSIGEGVTVIGNNGHIFLRKDRRSEEFQNLIARFPLSKQDEYGALLAMVLKDPDNRLSALGVKTLFVSWVVLTNGEIAFESVAKFDMRELIGFKAKKSKDFLKALASETALWVPPADYLPKFEFAVVE